MNAAPGLLDRLTERCVTPRPDCLIWSGNTDQGYGRVTIDGASRRVHRVVWELKHGPIPDGLTIDHLCRVRPCVNTAHMELVTPEENVRRSHRTRRRVSDTCPNGHAYAAVGVVVSRDGRRRCRECRRENWRRRDAKLRATRAATRNS